ncbi:MAG: energy transducer TonB [Candidatus Baltobacteraceae bacterium]
MIEKKGKETFALTRVLRWTRCWRRLGWIAGALAMLCSSVALVPTIATADAFPHFCAGDAPRGLMNITQGDLAESPLIVNEPAGAFIYTYQAVDEVTSRSDMRRHWHYDDALPLTARRHYISEIEKAAAVHCKMRASEVDAARFLSLYGPRYSKPNFSDEQVTRTYFDILRLFQAVESADWLSAGARRFAMSPWFDTERAPKTKHSKRPACHTPDREATVINQVTPEYPESLREQNADKKAPLTLEVLVLVSLSASATITAESVSQASGFPEVDRAALRAANASSYSPRVVNCKPVESQFIMRFSFDPTA